jgi:hypothetical protein
MTPTEDQFFEMVLRKQDEMHADVKEFAERLQSHIDDDRRLANEVLFIRRAFQATWTAVGLLLAYLGIKNVS